MEYFLNLDKEKRISPTRDLGVPINASNGNDYTHIGTLEDDTIHNLEVGNLDVRFGSKSKNGFMIISKLGTVIDVAKPHTSTDYISGLSSNITDGLNGATTSEADASLGTVIAYSEELGIKTYIS